MRIRPDGKFSYRESGRPCRRHCHLLSLAVGKDYDAKAFRDELRDNGVRPLIKHRLHNSLDHAHNARMDSDSYNCRRMVETVFSAIKRTLGSAVRARSWPLGFREMILRCAIYNFHRTVRYLQNQLR